MNLDIQTVTEVNTPANFIARHILEELNAGKKVLWFMTGGSSMTLGIEVAKIISQHPHKNLTVTLTDERYGPINHINSNWYQMILNGFNLPEATLIPVLLGLDRTLTAQKWNAILEQEFKNTDYKIGLFGVGKDGHVAGILPQSGAVNSQNLVFDYITETFERITITPKAISQLNEAVVFTQGRDKWQVIEDLKNEISLPLQPAQILKKVPLLKIFSDYNK
ncbi:6-phosphogluconolactonase [Candidatus Nomurabacteria bacterium]|nr:6-phosphogluconolactonase [Candidatus Nomurabacteria bacterium]